MPDPTQTTTSLEQMSREVCEALEPSPTCPLLPSPPHGMDSDGGLWSWDRATYRRRKAAWIPKDLCYWQNLQRLEALLRLDAARWERYGCALAEVLDLHPNDPPPFRGLDLADIATATPEQRLRAAARALGVG